MDSNGKHPAPGTCPAGTPHAPPQRVEVFRLEAGTVAHIRTISADYKGLFTHWVKGRSRYCFGETCDATVHRVDKTWKGYACVDVWNASLNAWVPWVLELTENLELDMRGYWARGQEWELFHDPESVNAHPPLMGKYQGDVDQKTLPQPWDYMPVLFTLYHTMAVKVGIPNPLPPRVYLAPTAGAPPKVVTEADRKGGPTYEEELQRLREAAMKQRRSPTQQGKTRK